MTLPDPRHRTLGDMRHLTIAAVLALVFAVGAPGVGAQSGYDLFQKALATERADGNLREAIQLYERVVKQFASDRPLVARALVRIADCYEKLGQRDATKVYERIVRDFSDQAESVLLARARLSALQSAPRAQLAQSVRQAWSGADVDPMGTASADGRYLSFTDWETGDLAVRDLTEEASRRITNTGGWQVSGDFAEYSVMSPDGRQIAYAWFTDKGPQPGASRCQCRYDLRVVATTGGDASKPRVLLQTTDSNEWLRPAAWMPDGKQLVVVRALPDRSHQLALLTLADNSLRVVKSFGWWDPDKVSVSPDGRFLVYDAAPVDRPASRDIYALTVDGGRETPVVQAVGHDRSPVWSADGGHVLFISDRTGTESLWRVPMRDGTAVGPAVIVAAISANSGLLGTTRSGAALYWTGGDSSNVYVANVDANFSATTPPTIAIERFLNSNNAPAWSPDGGRLAYLSRRGSNRASAAGALVIHSVVTGEARDVPTQIPVADQASWFPDGRSVLVASREPADGRWSFYRVDVTTGDAQLLLRSKGFGLPGRRPQVSPDGQAIVYADRGVGGDAGAQVARLMRFDIASGQEAELKKIDGHEGYFTSFAISPDGAEVAYLRFENAGRWSILEVMPQRGGESRELFRENNSTGSRYAGLGWTPDKRYIIVTRTTGTGASMRTSFWKVPVAGGAAEEMGISAPGAIRFPSLHPKGGRIAFAGTGGGSEPAIWMIENFLPRSR